MAERQHSQQHDGNRPAGPLKGVRIVEFEGIGPAPFACMLLADMGADIVRISRPGSDPALQNSIISRGRRVITADLKNESDRQMVLDLIEKADVLVEGYRPGVMERLGLGPEVVLARAPALVYGRMTGWGQTGPFAELAGHEINYVALTGALSAIGNETAPVVPLNLVGDYGGGAMFLVAGVLAALLNAKATGQGQVVDAAICDGTVLMMSLFYEMLSHGQWQDRRGVNLIDGGVPWYGTYRCRDGKFVAIGPIEPQFYALFLEKTGLNGNPAFAKQYDSAAYPAMRLALEALFALRTRDEWCEILENTDSCFAPVLSMSEVAKHPHIAARNILQDLDGVLRPTPAPRFDKTPSGVRASVFDSPAGIMKDWSV